MSEHDRPVRRFDPRQLPEFVPDTALWSRIAATQRQRLARRRWRTAGALGGAIAAALAIVVLVPSLRQPASEDRSTMQDQSRALEDEWTKLAGTHAPTIGTTHLRAIDAQLQAAYDRGAGMDELSPLWQQRNRALRGLIDGLRNGVVDRDDSITQI